MCMQDTQSSSQSKGGGETVPDAAPLLDYSSGSETTHPEMAAAKDDQAHADDQEQSEERLAEQEQPESETSPSPFRSVNGYDSKEVLRQALLSNEVKGTSCFHGGDELAWKFCSKEHRNLVFCDPKKEKGTTSSSRADSDLEAPEATVMDMSMVNKQLDWILNNYDESTSRKQSLEDELRRLLVLKSYLVLDTKQHGAFERLTDMAGRVFQVPIALISLVDLGRQWFLSNHGLGDVRETPRSISFCAHVIQSQLDCMVVHDASQDVRFQENPLVTGPLNIRFYAGAPLLSPEGVMLGTVCVLDSKPRTPEEFGAKEQQELIDMAAQAMDILVQHKKKMSLWFTNLVSTQFPRLKDMELELEQEEEASRSLMDDTSDLFSLDSVTASNDMDNSIRDTKVSQQMTSLYRIKRTRSSSDNNLMEECTKHKRMMKQFRFDEGKDGNVRTQVHTITSIKEFKDELWWNPEEMRQIRINAIRLVKQMRKQRPEYAECVNEMTTVQLQSYITAARDEREAIKLYGRILGLARGLELHIVGPLSNYQDMVQTMLDLQWECIEEEVDEVDEFLRSQSIIHSARSTRFASNLAQVDEFQVLFENFGPVGPVSRVLFENFSPVAVGAVSQVSDSAPVKPTRRCHSPCRDD